MSQLQTVKSLVAIVHLLYHDKFIYKNGDFLNVHNRCLISSLFSERDDLLFFAMVYFGYIFKYD